MKRGDTKAGPIDIELSGERGRRKGEGEGGMEGQAGDQKRRARGRTLGGALRLSCLA